MVKSLVAFENAMFNASVTPVVYLFSEIDKSFTYKRAKRNIDRWRTKSFAHHLQGALGATTGYQIEKILSKTIGNYDLSDKDFPRLFNRMLRTGEPSLSRSLERFSENTRLWLSCAFEACPQSEAVISHPVWRLLDPVPLTGVEWWELARELGRREPLDQAWDGLNDLELFELLLRSAKPDGTIVLFERPRPGTYKSLVSLASGLRHYEAFSDPVRYYQTLLELIDSCRQSENDSTFRIFMPELIDHLKSGFGRIYFGGAGERNAEFQCERLIEAKLEFDRAVGESSPGGVKIRQF